MAFSSPLSQALPRSKSHLVIEQAVAALCAGNPGDAEQSLKQWLFQHPDDVQVLAYTGDMLGEQGRDLEAGVFYKRALAHAPEADHIRLAFAFLLQRLNQFEAALKEVEALGQAARNRYGARALEAALLGVLGIHDRELTVYEQMIAECPKDEVLWMSYANALKAVGRTEDAVRALRRAIKARPTYGEAYWTLANFKTFRFGTKDVADMRAALKGKLSLADAIHFHFALGKALEDRDEFEGSFRHYARGNELRASGIPAATMLITPRVDAAIATFDKPVLHRFQGYGHEARDPIFIVGLHRSGSTLIEQILASHPMVEGTSELRVLEQLWCRLGVEGSRSGDPFRSLTELKAEQIRDLGAEYLERTRPFRLTDRPFFIDKQPANWTHVGFIKMILPNAKIIDARRNPMACGFSNFKQHYASGVTFAYSLEAIGRFYADYLRLMNHFDDVLPGAVHHVINERLIDDPEREVRQLLDYAGLPFDPACLEFHKNTRAVHTPSAEQVRRPINRDGVDYWRRYERWLPPLEEALGDAVTSWDKIPPRE